MLPLQVTAQIAGPICIPEHPIALDALLAWAVCQRDEIPPPLVEPDLRHVEIPIARSDCGRFYLASFAQYAIEERERSHTNRRPVVPELQVMSPRTNRIQVTAGPNKGYRIPREHLYLVDDLLTWWCVGEPADIRALIEIVMYLGKKRGVGLGRVVRWRVFDAEPWGDGFPVARDGRALRTLPAEYPWLGMVEPELGYGNLSAPYWRRSTEEQCVVPEVPR